MPGVSNCSQNPRNCCRGIYADNSNSNVSTDSGGMNSSDTAYAATVTENVTNGASQQVIIRTILRDEPRNRRFHLIH